MSQQLDMFSGGETRKHDGMRRAWDHTSPDWKERALAGLLHLAATTTADVQVCELRRLPGIGHPVKHQAEFQRSKLATTHGSMLRAWYGTGHGPPAARPGRLPVVPPRWCGVKSLTRQALSARAPHVSEARSVGDCGSNSTVEPGRANDRAPDTHLDWRWLSLPTIVARPQPSDNTPRRRRPLHDAVDELLPTNECVPWPGSLKMGYGPYREVYIRHRGPVPAGRVLDHRCHTFSIGCLGGEECPHRACVNPAHLEPVTNRENMIRARMTKTGQCNVGRGWPVSDRRCI